MKENHNTNKEKEKGVKDKKEEKEGAMETEDIPVPSVGKKRVKTF